MIWAVLGVLCVVALSLVLIGRWMDRTDKRLQEIENEVALLQGRAQAHQDRLLEIVPQVDRLTRGLP